MICGWQVLVPSMLFGISIGVVLCPLSPEWVQTALLSVLLMAVTHRTFSQGVGKWRQEQLARAYASGFAMSSDAISSSSQQGWTSLSSSQKPFYHDS